MPSQLGSDSQKVLIERLPIKFCDSFFSLVAMRSIGGPEVGVEYLDSTIVILDSGNTYGLGRVITYSLDLPPCALYKDVDVIRRFPVWRWEPSRYWIRFSDQQDSIYEIQLDSRIRVNAFKMAFYGDRYILLKAYVLSSNESSWSYLGYLDLSRIVDKCRQEHNCHPIHTIQKN